MTLSLRKRDPKNEKARQRFSGVEGKRSRIPDVALDVTRRKLHVFSQSAYT